jgi:hypothetical protein
MDTLRHGGSMSMGSHRANGMVKHKTVPNSQKLHHTGNLNGGANNAAIHGGRGANGCYAIIPTQNKGLCTFCDVNVWVVVKTTFKSSGARAVRTFGRGPPLARRAWRRNVCDVANGSVKSSMPCKRRKKKRREWKRRTRRGRQCNTKIRKQNKQRTSTYEEDNRDFYSPFQYEIEIVIRRQQKREKRSSQLNIISTC